MPTTTLSESEILADMLTADQGDLPVEVARAVMRWKFSRRATNHINKLAKRNEKGTITAVEREELERYLRVGRLVNLLQAKARLSLRQAERD